MTPEQESYRDLWMSECWPVVREWSSTRDERADAAERNALLDRPVRQDRGAA